MKKKRTLSSIGFLSVWVYIVYGQITPYTITFFIRTVPKLAQEQQQAKAKKYAAKKGKLVKLLLKRELYPERRYSGVYVSHLGQLARSDMHGQATLPRKNSQTSFYVLITEDLKPLFLSNTKRNTLTGFIIDPKAHSEYYFYELKRDPETELFTWYVSEQQVPQDKIPLDALIIFADPKDIIVPLGTTITASRTNLILPGLYTTEYAQPTLNALRFLKLKKFFSIVRFMYTIIPQGYQQRVL